MAQCATPKKRALRHYSAPSSHVPPLQETDTGTPAPSPRIDDEEISQIFRKMENNGAPGPDHLSVRALKTMHHYHPNVLVRAICGSMWGSVLTVRNDLNMRVQR